jgi:hypothetical protein
MERPLAAVESAYANQMDGFILGPVALELGSKVNSSCYCCVKADLTVITVCESALAWPLRGTRW